MTDRLPIGIAKDFEMTYTDSMKIKSLINAPSHKYFSNHPINYSEFVDGIKVTLFDEDRTTTITSDYAILYNRFRTRFKYIFKRMNFIFFLLLKTTTRHL